MRRLHYLYSTLTFLMSSLMEKHLICSRIWLFVALINLEKIHTDSDKPWKALLSGPSRTQTQNLIAMRWLWPWTYSSDSPNRTHHKWIHQYLVLKTAVLIRHTCLPAVFKAIAHELWNTLIYMSLVYVLLIPPRFSNRIAESGFKSQHLSLTLFSTMATQYYTTTLALGMLAKFSDSVLTVSNMEIIFLLRVGGNSGFHPSAAVARYLEEWVASWRTQQN